MNHFTLNDLFEFTQKEEKMIEEVLSEPLRDEDAGPSEACIRNISQYARSLSLRRSRMLGTMQLLLN